MTDLKALPDDHVLKPLETRMLEMASDMGPLMVQGGNFVAALRVFAGEHPGLGDSTITCPRCGRKGWESECVGPTFDERWDGVAIEEYDSEGELIAYYHICPACAEKTS